MLLFAHVETFSHLALYVFFVELTSRFSILILGIHSINTLLIIDY